MGGSRVKDMWGLGSGGVGSRGGVVGLTLDYLKSEKSFVFREKNSLFRKILVLFNLELRKLKKYESVKPL